MPAATAVPSQARAIFFLSIAAFAAAGTTRVMDAILPQIAQEFNVTIGAVAFVATAYAFTYGAFQLVFGPLGDRYGKYRVILFACIGSAVTTYVCAFAGSVAGIAGARLASGMMAAAIVPLAIAWVGDVVAAGERQHILARFLSGQILGLLAGQIGGGVLGEYFGWRSAFLFIGTVYLLAVAGLVEVAERYTPTALDHRRREEGITCMQSGAADARTRRRLVMACAEARYPPYRRLRPH